MIESKKVKGAMKVELKKYFGKKWAIRLAEEIDYTADHIRKYFREEIRQPLILAAAKEMIEKARTNEQEFIREIKEPTPAGGDVRKTNR